MTSIKFSAIHTTPSFISFQTQDIIVAATVTGKDVEDYLGILDQNGQVGLITSDRLDSFQLIRDGQAQDLQSVDEFDETAVLINSMQVSPNVREGLLQALRNAAIKSGFARP